MTDNDDFRAMAHDHLRRVWPSDLAEAVISFCNALEASQATDEEVAQINVLALSIANAALRFGANGGRQLQAHTLVLSNDKGTLQ